MSRETLLQVGSRRAHRVRWLHSLSSSSAPCTVTSRGRGRVSSLPAVDVVLSVSKGWKGGVACGEGAVP